jgi:NifU-like protein involved in Fe-S cluster formation
MVEDRSVQPEVALSRTAAGLFAAPRHAGRPRCGMFRHGRGGGVKSGSLIEFWLGIQDERVIRAYFEAFGCPSAIACGEWLCEWLVGREVEAARRLTGLELAEALDLAPAKRAVALTAEDALQAALAAPPCKME